MDLGAGGSLVGIKLVDTQRCCKEIRRELSWGKVSDVAEGIRKIKAVLLR